MAATAVGAFGFVDGVADDEASDERPVPFTLVPVTLTVYAVPLARPVMMHVVVTPSGV